MNSFGQLFRVTSFGESHGPVIGVVIDGCPAGLKIDLEKIALDLARRRPGQSDITSPRAEKDQPEILSGVFKGKTTGSPICLQIRNEDCNSQSYEARRFTPRPGHADYTTFVKYGGFEDYRGGGRFSARITAGWTMAGSLAKQLLATLGVKIIAHTVEIGGIQAAPATIEGIENNVETNPVRCADLHAAAKMAQRIEEVQAQGDSVGGIIEGLALNLPVGLGEPVFDNLDGELAKAMFAIPAVKAVEIGDGFEAALKLGSENNDPIILSEGNIVTKTNHAGGILGGLSNGMPLIVRVGFKPIASIRRPQQTVHLEQGKEVMLETEGRFDPCPISRAVPLVEAMMAIVLADFALQAQWIPRVLKTLE